MVLRCYLETRFHLAQPVYDNTLQVSKLCAFGSDGVAVMTIISNGIAVRLRGHSPNMIAVHYVNHKLAAHASDSVPFLKQFIQTLFYSE